VKQCPTTLLGSLAEIMVSFIHSILGNRKSDEYSWKMIEVRSLEVIEWCVVERCRCRHPINHTVQFALRCRSSAAVETFKLFSFTSLSFSCVIVFCSGPREEYTRNLYRNTTRPTSPWPTFKERERERERERQRKRESNRKLKSIKHADVSRHWRLYSIPASRYSSDC